MKESEANTFTDTLRRLFRVQRHEIAAEERKWQEEQREKRERPTP